MDPDQHLFEVCKNSEQLRQHDDGVGKITFRKCQKPAELFQETCNWHGCLQSTSSTEKALIGFEIAKKSREARKRKQEQMVVTTKIEKRDEKKEPIHHNTRRASAKTKDEHLKSPLSISPSGAACKPSKISFTQANLNKKHSQIETTPTEIEENIMKLSDYARKEKLLTAHQQKVAVVNDAQKETISDSSPKSTIADCSPTTKVSGDMEVETKDDDLALSKSSNDGSKVATFDGAPKETISDGVSRESISSDMIVDDDVIKHVPSDSTNKTDEISAHQNIPTTQRTTQLKVIENETKCATSEIMSKCPVGYSIPKVNISSERITTTTLLSPELAENITIPSSMSTGNNHKKTIFATDTTMKKEAEIPSATNKPL